jgi:hypothetical protein
MLASINPLGERGRNQRYTVTVVAYVTATTLGAGALGAALGLLGSVLPASRATLAVLAGLAVAGVVVDIGLFGMRVPGPQRQVDETWLMKYRGWVYGAGFGLQLGFAFTTIVTASATWIAYACAAASGGPLAGALIGSVFGLARALPILSTVGVRDPAGLRRRFRMLARARPALANTTTAAQLGAALYLVAVAL